MILDNKRTYCYHSGQGTGSCTQAARVAMASLPSDLNSVVCFDHVMADDLICLQMPTGQPVDSQAKNLGAAVLPINGFNTKSWISSCLTQLIWSIEFLVSYNGCQGEASGQVVK